MPSVTIGPWRYELSEVLSSDRLDALFSDAWTGSRVWNASIFLSNHLVRLHAEQSFLRNATQTSRAGRVIELGSGCGLVGLVARDLGAAHVVVTDQAEIVDLLAANLHENASSTGGTAHACEFTWGSLSFRHLLVDDTPFDYILVCYLSYEERGDNAALADFQACSDDYLNHELLLQEGKIHLYRITPKRSTK
ncbi:unnamed protein product [Aphanomyces euteiches]